MDMSSKMDGSVPVSQALGGVWEIQKRGRIVTDQRDEKRKKDKDDQGEEKFEDGLVPNEEEVKASAEAEVEKEEADSEAEGLAATRKIDIVI